MTPRQYLFALVDAGGNVPPELHAVRRLIERGHAVTVLADDSVEPEVRSTGADFRRWVQAPNRANRLPEHDPSRDWECKYPWQLVDRLVDTLLVGPAAGYACDVREAISRCRPSLVACSMFCLGGMLAAEAVRIPFVVLFPNVYPLPARGLPPFGIGLPPARGRLGRWRDEILNRIIERQWDRKGLKGLNTLRRTYGLAPLAHMFDQVRGAYRQLVMTSPAFDFPATLPAAVRYVGPVLDDPVWSQALQWTPSAGREPLVLVAMSSTFQDQCDSLRRVIAALRTLPVHGIVTTGPAISPAALGAAPNVTVLACAPHREVLRQAVAVVTHGGHGTVVKALAAGVPMVLLPHGRDQGDTAVRVTARGAGIALERTAQPEAIAAAVREVIENPTFRASAQRLGESVRRDADAAALLRELEDIPVERSVGSTVGTRTVS
jgi:UDP:flavonoid glycosyltransferase YjiC (YdhE family)